jgi:hypothetical protein
VPQAVTAVGSGPFTGAFCATLAHAVAEIPEPRAKTASAINGLIEIAVSRPPFDFIPLPS